MRIDPMAWKLGPIRLAFAVLCFGGTWFASCAQEVGSGTRLSTGSAEVAAAGQPGVTTSSDKGPMVGPREEASSVLATVPLPAKDAPAIQKESSQGNLLLLRAEVRSDQIEIGTLKERLVGVREQLSDLRDRADASRDKTKPVPAGPLRASGSEVVSPDDTEATRLVNPEIQALREQVTATQAQLRAVMQAVEQLDEMARLREANRVLRNENQQLRRLLSATQNVSK